MLIIMTDFSYDGQLFQPLMYLWCWSYLSYWSILADWSTTHWLTTGDPYVDWSTAVRQCVMLIDWSTGVLLTDWSIHRCPADRGVSSKDQWKVWSVKMFIEIKRSMKGLICQMLIEIKWSVKRSVKDLSQTCQRPVKDLSKTYQKANEINRPVKRSINVNWDQKINQRPVKDQLKINKKVIWDQ